MRAFGHKQFTGFTIIEVLVVIVVISILVAIAVVGYGNYQERTRDAERRSDLQQLAAALKTYANWKNNFIESGSSCGAGGNGTGWVAVGTADDATYQTSIEQCLANENLLKVGEGTDPTGCKRNSGGTCGTGSPTRAYMKTNCTVSGVKKVYVMASLETVTGNTAPIDALCNSSNGCTLNCNQNWGTAFGMNYYVEAS